MRALLASTVCSLLAATAAAAPELRTMHLTLRGRADLDLVMIPPGSFLMGSEIGEPDERPVRRVEMRHGFWMSRTEVTQRQYESVMATNPSTFRGPSLPVETLSYRDVQSFLGKLPQRSSLPADLMARLPTEAEWEYACRGGLAHPIPDRLDADALGRVAWYGANSTDTTQPVGAKDANGYGLQDMLGNVWEWCDDAYLERFYAMTDVEEDPRGPQVGSTRVLRGGCWRSDAETCRPSNRFQYRMWSKDHTVGFRIVVVPK